MRSIIDWHYPRADVASAILQQFQTGITNAVTLFAPRRMGKTELLRCDLTPAAEALGYTVIYVSMWEQKDTPETALLEALLTQSRLSGIDLEFELSGFGAKGKLTKKSVAQKGGTTTVEIARAFRTLIKSKAPVLLMLDEVQHLATRREFESTIALLRTLLDENKREVKTIFTGSSRDALLSMFRSRKAPLFNASQQMDLPELGDEFVKYMVSAFNSFAKKPIDHVNGIVSFRRLHRVPASFHDLLTEMMMAGRNDILPAVDEYLAERSKENNYEFKWNELKEVEKLLIKQIASGDSAGLFNEEFRSLLANTLGVDEVQVHTVQNALNRMRVNGVICAIGRGQYALEDPAFHEWICENLP